MTSPQSRHADMRPALRVYNPQTESLLGNLRAAVAALRSAVEAGEVNSGDALGVAAQVHEIGEQVRGLHYAVVEVADQSGLWGVAGYTNTNAWLRHTHLLDGRGANRVSRTARWLGNQAEVAHALAAGEITEGHVQRMRVVVTRSPACAEAFRAVAEEFVTIARNADPDYLGRVLRSWADTVDAHTSNDTARISHEKRGLFLAPVADGWDVQGWLSESDGAELAGILNERMAQDRRESPDISLSASQRRVDALLDLIRTGAKGAFTPAQRDRAKVLVLVPVDRMTGCSTCRRDLGEHLVATAKQRALGRDGSGLAPPATSAGLGGKLRGGSSPEQRGGEPPGGWSREQRGGEPPGGWSREQRGGEPPGGWSSEQRGGEPPGGWSSEQRGGELPDLAAGQWRVVNGTGRGHMSMQDVQRLSCDGGIQRVVLSPESAVLDVGRSQRLVTPAIRTALEVRDGGCVVPGCDRPTGWCEAHHIQHWSNGGETSVQNLVLTCSRHHHEIHQGKWRVRIDDTGEPLVSQAHPRPVHPVQQRK